MHRLLFKAMAILAIALAFPVFSAGAQGQTPPSARDPWTLPRLLRDALASYPSIAGKLAERDAAAATLEGARWGRYPSVTLEASRGTPSSSTASGTFSTGVVRVDQPLWAGGRIDAHIDGSRSRLEAAGFALNEAQMDVALRVAAAYGEALRQLARLDLAQISYDEHKKLFDMIRRRTEQEVSPEVDARLAESRLNQASNELSLSRLGLRNALNQLSQLCGAAVERVSTAGMPHHALPTTLEEAVTRAIDSSPTLKRLSEEEAAAVSDIDIKRSLYQPQVLFRLERQAGGDIATESRGMVVLQMQPGAGLSAVSEVGAAVSRREAARLARATAERSLRERVTQDWNDWKSASERLETASQTSEISRQVAESYARQYIIGRKTWIDVLNSVRETAQAGLTQEDSRAQKLVAELRLLIQLGVNLIP